MVPFIVSTSIAPYKQWLTGGVVVLCDVAAAAASPVWSVVLLWALLAVAVAVDGNTELVCGTDRACMCCLVGR